MTKKLGLSVVAAAAMLTTSAMALENVKVDGGIKLWYQTVNDDAQADDSFFDATSDAANESGDLTVNLGVTAQATKKVGLGFRLYSVSTLGLENNVVEGEAVSNGSQNGGLNGSGNMPMWLGESYFTYTAGSTLFKIGRQELDTPFAFTEKWNAAPNTFEAAVVVNSSLPSTTLIGAYVARGNGANNALGANTKTVVNGFNNYWAGVAGAQDTGGAYAIAAVFNGIENLPVKAFYYDVADTANAFWLDANFKMGNIGLTGIYAMANPAGVTEDFLDGLGDADATTAFAAKVCGKFDALSAYAAFSSVSEGNLPIANTATNFKKTKLPTASIFSDGMYAAQPDTTSMKIGASYAFTKATKLALSYGSYSVGENKGYASVWGAAGNDTDTTEIDVVVATKVDEINLKAMYINQANYNAAEDDRSIIRVVAGINF